MLAASSLDFWLMLSLCGNAFDFKLYSGDISSVTSSRKSYQTPHPPTTSQCLYMTGHGDLKVTLRCPVLSSDLQQCMPGKVLVSRETSPVTLLDQEL